MKIVSTTGKSSPGFKHIKEQTNLSDFGFISYCPFERVKRKQSKEEEKGNQEGVKA